MQAMSTVSTPALPPACEVLCTLAVLLRVLLGALFGGGEVRRQRGHRGLDGSIAAPIVLPEAELWEEWVAVPAPWRNGRWAVPPRLRAHCAARPCRPAPYAAPVRAPPGCFGNVCRLESRFAMR